MSKKYYAGPFMRRIKYNSVLRTLEAAENLGGNAMQIFIGFYTFNYINR